MFTKKDIYRIWSNPENVTRNQWIRRGVLLRFFPSLHSQLLQMAYFFLPHFIFFYTFVLLDYISCDHNNSYFLMMNRNYTGRVFFYFYFFCVCCVDVVNCVIWLDWNFATCIEATDDAIFCLPLPGWFVWMDTKRERL